MAKPGGRVSYQMARSGAGEGVGLGIKVPMEKEWSIWTLPIYTESHGSIFQYLNVSESLVQTPLLDLYPEQRDLHNQG